VAPADLAPYPFKARQHGDEVVRFFGIIHSSGLRRGPHLTVDAECQARMPSVVPASGIPRYDFAGRSPSQSFQANRTTAVGSRLPETTFVRCPKSTPMRRSPSSFSDIRRDPPCHGSVNSLSAAA
jgi:hypothetical protein